MSSAITRTAIVLLGVAATSLVAWFAVAEANGSRLYSPAPLSTLLPVLYLERGLGLLAVETTEVRLVAWVGCIYGVALLAHLLRGRDRIPRVSPWLFALAAVADMAFLTWVFQHGVQYQGLVYTLALTFLNVGLILAMAFVLRRNWRSPSFTTNYGFHLMLALWLCWFSFPWFGEMP